MPARRFSIPTGKTKRNSRVNDSDDYQAEIPRKPGKYCCPECSKSKADKPLSVHYDGSELFYKCHRCGKKGKLSDSRDNGQSAAKYVLEATYYYANSDGSVRYRVQRKVNPSNPKDKQYPQHPSNGHGGWKTGQGCMEGVERILYRLPELLAADPSEPVFICGGEKCTDAVRELRLVATCNSGGEGVGRFGLGGGPDYLEPLKGHPIVVLADSDLPDPRQHNRRKGYDHTQDVAGKVKPIAASMKAFELPGVPADGGDVFDWIKAGGTGKRLLELAAAAPEWMPAGSGNTAVKRPANDDPGSIITVEDFYAYMPMRCTS